MIDKLPPLTYSMIRDFDCPAKFYQRHVLLRRLIAVKESLRIGSLYHEGREKGLDHSLAEIRKGSILSQFDADKQAKDEAMITGMLKGAETAFDDIEVEREPEWLQPIVNPDTGRQSKKFRTAGKADGYYVEGNTAVIIEEKTKSGSPGEADISRLDLDAQVLNEVSNLQRSRGVPISRVIYRYIVKPYIKQTKNETVEQFCDRLEADYQTRLDFYFHEYDILVDQSRVRQWERDLWRIAHTIAYAHKHDLWYRNTSRCAEWGGCSYLPLCRGEDVDHLYETVTIPNPELTQEVSHE